MNITKFDVAIIFSMSICVILLTLAAPAFGMTDQSAANESDIPRFNASGGNFDIVGEFPESPGTPNSGRLTYNTAGAAGDGINNLWLQGDDPSNAKSLQIVTGNSGNTTDPDADVTITEWRNGAIYHQETYVLDDVGDTAQYQNDSWNIRVEFDSFRENTDDGTKVNTAYEVLDSPDDEGLLSGIPIVGDIADALAGLVGWLGAITFWFFGTLIEVTVTLITQLVNVVVWFASTLYWMTSTYLTVATSAPGFASALVMVPGIILFAEFAKVIAVAISLLPTT